MKVKRSIAIFLLMLMLFSTFTSTSVLAVVQSSQGIDFERLSSTTAEIVGLTPGSQAESSPVVTIPSSLKNCLLVSVAKEAFKDNAVQEEIILPDSIGEISTMAFYNATKLKTFTFPRNVQILGDIAFAYCNSLSNVTFNTNSISILPRGLFYNCASLDNVVIPSSVNTIKDLTFANCNSLKKIYIPTTVSVIDDTAFQHSDNVTIYGTIGSTAYHYAFDRGIPFVELSTEKSIGDLNIWLTASEYRLSEDLSLYIPSTVQKLQEEYAKAIIVRDDFFSTQADIDTATANLSTAFKSLKLTAMLQLETTVANANALLENSDIYTEDSANQLYNAVTSAEVLIKNNSQSVADINEMNNLVSNKVSALILQSKVDLQALVAKADEVIKTEDYKYAETSITELTTAINNANSVLENSNSTDEAYKAEIENLTQLCNSLSPLVIGDVNYDNTVNVSDVIIVLKNLVSSSKLDQRNQYVSDMNADGKVSIIDAIMIQQVILELA